MKYLVEDVGKKRNIYESLLIDDLTSLSALSNKTAVSLIKELSQKPLCAMDLARRLGVHEQKVYYNLRRLEKAGIIKLLRTEERTGGTAKIYSLVKPVISVKLSEDAFLITDKRVKIRTLDTLDPFVVGGKLNAKIILGDTYSHGKFDAPAVEGPYVFDFAIFLGEFLIESNFPTYRLDTEIKRKDLENNLILIGQYRTNIIIQRINRYLPVYFDPNHGFNIISKLTKKVYEDPRVGMVQKLDNPFSKDKKVLLLSGIGRRGVQSAIIAFTRYQEKLDENNGIIIKVVKGFDSDGDKIIDSVKFLE